MAPAEQLFGVLCAEAGLTCSDKIRAILAALSESDKALTTQDVHQLAQKHYPLAVPTAYRLLKLLAASGVVRRYDLGDRVARYVFRTRSEQALLMNVADGRGTAFEDSELGILVAEISKDLGYKLVTYRLVMYGEAEASPTLEARHS